jgi:hypothetical protein
VGARHVPHEVLHGRRAVAAGWGVGF